MGGSSPRKRFFSLLNYGWPCKGPATFMGHQGQALCTLQVMYPSYKNDYFDKLIPADSVKLSDFTFRKYMASKICICVAMLFFIAIFFTLLTDVEASLTTMQ